MCSTVIPIVRREPLGRGPQPVDCGLLVAHEWFATSPRKWLESMHVHASSFVQAVGECMCTLLFADRQASMQAAHTNGVGCMHVCTCPHVAPSPLPPNTPVRKTRNVGELCSRIYFVSKRTRKREGKKKQLQKHDTTLDITLCLKHIIMILFYSLLHLSCMKTKFHDFFQMFVHQTQIKLSGLYCVLIFKNPESVYVVVSRMF